MSHPHGGRRGALLTEKARLNRSLTTILKYLWDYIKVYKWKLILGSILSILISVLSVISPIILKDGIDLLAKGNASSTEISYLFVLFALIMLLSWVFSSLVTRILADLQARMLYSMRKDMFEQLLNADLSYLKNEKSGDITAKITGDTNEVGSGIQITMNSATQLLLLVASFYILIVEVHWYIALIALASVPIAFLLTWVLSTYGRRLVKQIRTAFGTVSAKMAESLAGVAISKVFNREKEIAKELRYLNQQHYNYNKRFGLLMQFMMPTINTVSVITTAVIILVGGRLYNQGVITIGEIYLGTILAQRFLMPIINLAMSWAQIQSSIGAMDRIIDVLEVKPSVTEKPDAKPLETGNESVTFKNVSFAYTNNTYVIKDISFHVEKGETIAVVGETGAGKTTLFTALLPRFYDPQKGEIYIGKQNIKDVTLQSLRENIGLILQEPYLFTGTVMENIKYSNPSISDEDVKKICKMIGADEFIEALPKGYETIVREGGKKLSAGQRQMITIARTMLSNPRILVMDEATSRLDSYSESMVQYAQSILFKDRTTFVIAHRLSTIRNAHRILVIDNGRLVEQGTHETLLKKNGVYAELYYTYYSFQGANTLSLTEEQWQAILREEQEQIKQQVMSAKPFNRVTKKQEP